MDDARWTWWALGSYGDLEDVVACALVVGLLGLRMLPSTRRWAPRGNAWRARQVPAPRGGGSADPRRPPSLQR
ncbi:hypothetical protein [Nocardioides furvisabuli]|uniref:Uncharacterized protein n=1 Tax=Nocardioides furvisabuli TaxID=375542 RepID=A0ABN2X157_9ACTN|nr:hypothetical protein [Nocardioides furvisabuli]